MSIYHTFLSIMSGLFLVAATVLLVMSIVQAARKQGRRAAIYLALTVLASVVAAGFHFFRGIF